MCEHYDDYYDEDNDAFDYTDHNDDDEAFDEAYNDKNNDAYYDDDGADDGVDVMIMMITSWSWAVPSSGKIELATHLLKAKVTELLAVYYIHWLSRIAVSIKWI